MNEQDTDKKTAENSLAILESQGVEQSAESETKTNECQDAFRVLKMIVQVKYFQIMTQDAITMVIHKQYVYYV